MELKSRIVPAARLAAILAVVSGGAHARNLAATKEVHRGTTSKRQILDQSEDLCRSLLALREQAKMTAEEFTLEEKDGEARHYWTVDCYDDLRQLAHLVWNADNGELGSMSTPRTLSEVPLKPISAELAMKCGRSWIEKLKFGGKWKGTGRPEPGLITWSCRYSSGKRTVTVLMTSGDGNLISAKCSPI